MDNRSPAGPLTVLRCLGHFAVAHFSLSLLSSGIGLFAMDSPILIFLLPPFLMALYYPLGLLFGASIEDHHQLALAVLSQAAIAWCWAGLVIWALHGAGEDALLYAVLITFPLAYPSSLLVIAGMFLFGIVGCTSLSVSLTLLAIPAGLLPPLLFNLGSFCATRHKTQNGPALERKNTKRTAE